MNQSSSSISQYKDLNEFLAKHSAKSTDKQIVKSVGITHTRIPNKELNIFAGAYVIPTEELGVFYQLYYEHVFEKKRKEYLTERQLTEACPMAIDLDFRYSHEVSERPHTRGHVTDIICAYLDALKEYFIFERDQTMPIYVFEKPTVNRLTDGSLTKDGIHIIFGMQVDRLIQIAIREKMLTELTDYLDLPLINTMESVLDEGITAGTTNWPLYGSRKPNHDAYELTHLYMVTYDPTDDNFEIDEKRVSDFDLKRNFHKLSVQYPNHISFEMRPEKKAEIDALREAKVGKTKTKKTASRTKLNLIIDEEDAEDENHIPLESIRDEDTLRLAVDKMLKSFHAEDYESRELHEYVQALPPRFYEQGSHLESREVAFALKLQNENLFLSWVMLRSKASDFEYDSIPSLFAEWKGFRKRNASGKSVTKRSIIYWVKTENYDAYEKIRSNTIHHYIEKAMETCAEYDYALLLKQMFKDNYVCVSYNGKGVWYQFRNHRWVPDKGLQLRAKISTDLYNLFGKRSEEYESEVAEYAENDERREFLKKRVGIIHQIKITLKKTAHKDHIMREAAELFFDEYFQKNIDTNEYLMCFNNGVVDFKNKVFRDGLPEDYLTKTTDIDYVPYNPEDPHWKKNADEIHRIMNTLFPVPDLNQYMWDHLASVLIGANLNQTFNVYHGSGANGKSVLTELMSKTLGEYKGIVPTNLVTDARAKIGGITDEILQLKGVRYAVLQEPKKGTTLNEGIMKELTGDTAIQARGLYVSAETFCPQFKLVVCTNNLFDIDSNEDGTWRRIRRVPFMSKFVDEGEYYEDDTPYVFPKDHTLSQKFPELAPVFASMLVQRAFETGGLVVDCKTVMDASKKYRGGQDHISAYISERLRKTDDTSQILKKKVLYDDFTLWYKHEQGINRKVPKGEELFEHVNRKFCECGKKGWVGLEFVRDDDEEEDVLNQI